MLDIKQIRDMASKQARIAKRNGIKPSICTDKKTFNVRALPFIGDYVPAGFYLLDSLFVDSSGFGAPGEAALTYNAFLEKIEVGKAYAIRQAGEFQVYIGVYGVNQ